MIDLDLDDKNFGSLEELQAHLDKITKAQNTTGLAQFEGYSPEEMHHIIHFPLDNKCPLTFKKLTPSQYLKIPIFNQVKYLMNLLDEAQELKLTAKGFLPTKVVKDIYSQGFMKDKAVETGITKLYKESDSTTIRLPRFLLEIGGITKKRKNKLSLTKKGEKLLKNDEDLLSNLFLTMGTKFNWAYYDGYGENGIGQMAFTYSLILLHKYGKKQRTGDFYAKKYFTAFPMLKDQVTYSPYSSMEERAIDCYNIRTFERFAKYFGLIDTVVSPYMDKPILVNTTKWYDQLIDVKAPGKLKSL